MASIKIAELNIAGSELFQDSESFLNELNDVDTITVHGGGGDSGVSHITGLIAGVYYHHLAYEANVKGMEFIYKLASKFSFTKY